MLCPAEDSHEISSIIFSEKKLKKKLRVSSAGALSVNGIADLPGVW